MTDIQITGLCARAVDVPLQYPVKTAAGTAATSPLVLIDLQTRANVTGTAYLVTDTPLALTPAQQMVEALAAVVTDIPLAPYAIDQQMQSRFRLVEVMTGAIAARACDLCMPELMKIEGVSGWLRASALAGQHGQPMSSHIFQEFSAHLLAVPPHLPLARTHGSRGAGPRARSAIQRRQGAFRRRTRHGNHLARTRGGTLPRLIIWFDRRPRGRTREWHPSAPKIGRRNVIGISAI